VRPAAVLLTDAALVFLCGLLVGVVIGMVVQWLSDLTTGGTRNGSR